MGGRSPKSVIAILISAGLLPLLFTGISCGPEEGESPTRGNLHVVTAESVSPVVTKVADEFNRLYPNAHVSLSVATTREAIVSMLNSEVKVIVSARELNSEEQEVVAKNGLYVEALRIAYDGIAVVVHPSNPVNRLSLEELRAITTGKIKSWRNLQPRARKSPEIFVAVGGPNTSEYEVIKTKVARDEPFTDRIYPCSTSTQVLKLVRQRPEAIGFVGTAWLLQDSAGVKVLEIGTEEYHLDANGRMVRFFDPHPAHIYREFYPLRRTIYLYSREKGYGLGAGFISFAASGPGQKIFLDNGLVPAVQPVRLTQPTASK
jgi:phosphate transport system substrate-binding protein